MSAFVSLFAGDERDQRADVVDAGARESFAA